MIESENAASMHILGCLHVVGEIAGSIRIGWSPVLLDELVVLTFTRIQGETAVEMWISLKLQDMRPVPSLGYLAVPVKSMCSKKWARPGRSSWLSTTWLAESHLSNHHQVLSWHMPTLTQSPAPACGHTKASHIWIHGTKSQWEGALVHISTHSQSRLANES